MPTRSIAELERIRYRDGQLLTSRDLQDDRDFEALLRWMHTRFLHNTWGIAFGFDVQLMDPSTLQISSGLAYDCYGRELLVTRAYTIDRPMMGPDEQLDLVIRYKADAEFPNKLDVVAVCQVGVPDPRQGQPIVHAIEEQPLFFWKRPTEVRIGEEIPLTRMRSDAVGNVTLTHGVRRNARPSIRPHVGYGLAVRDITSLVPWTVILGGVAEPIGSQMDIDTSEAGFTQTPCYIVTTKLLIQLPQTQVSLPVQGFGSIAASRAQMFTYRILVPGIATMADSITSLLAVRPLMSAGISIPIKLSVSWIGIEPG
jgi:hypothetical protein